MLTPVITLAPIPSVPVVEIELNLIVVNPSALNCSFAPPGPPIVTVGAEIYPYPLFPILIVLTVPATETVTDAVA